MKYQVGDKVQILHSDEEGTIVDFINDKMVMVDVRGVQFPVYTDQIDFPYFKNFSQKKKEPSVKQRRFVDDLKKEKNPVKDKTEDGVWLNFLPVSDTDEFGDEVIELLKVHLINNTRTAYQFKYSLRFFGEDEFELKNTLLPFQDFYIHDIPFGDMSDSPSFDLEFMLVTPEKSKAAHFETSVKLKPRQLFSKIEELRQKNQATFANRLFETYPDKVPEEDPMNLSLNKLSQKFKVYNAQEARRHLEPARTVVDLHIEKLTDNPARMSNFEMLTLQLDTFEKFYTLAVAHMQPMLTIIHGVGTGKLRDEIHDALRHKKEVSYFVNQYHPSYGYGATEIHFKY